MLVEWEDVLCLIWKVIVEYCEVLVVLKDCWLFDIEYVIEMYDEILEEFGGLLGFVGVGCGGVEVVFVWVENYVIYNGINDIFGIVVMYVVVIVWGYVFNDGNKCIGLICVFVYFECEGYLIFKIL